MAEIHFIRQTKLTHFLVEIGPEACRNEGKKINKVKDKDQIA
jgi:hypothetical protein